MPKSIYVKHLSEQPNSNPHHLNRLIKLLNHFISVEPPKRTKGFECHHIVPKSWKPKWSKESDNLLKVPAKAHYVIHHLMWKAFPDSISMSRSFWFFIGKGNKNKVTAKIYENLKKNLSVSKETKRKMSETKKGKPSNRKGKTLKEETKRKISDTLKRKTGA